MSSGQFPEGGHFSPFEQWAVLRREGHFSPFEQLTVLRREGHFSPFRQQTIPRGESPHIFTSTEDAHKVTENIYSRGLNNLPDE